MRIIRRLKLSTVLIFVILLTSSFGKVSAQNIDVSETKFIDLEKNATRLYVYDDQDVRYKHYTYLIGEDIDAEPEGNTYEPSHIFRYSKMDLVNNVSDTPENVTDQLVLPFQYNLVVDETGIVHTAYVTNNYTVYYAYRTLDGVWNSEEINTPSQWYGWAPTIALGENDNPRIVYANSFKEDAADYFGISFGISGRRSLIYSVRDDSGQWTHYDVGDNHGVLTKSPNVFYIFYPSLKINDGYAYITFNNRLTLSAESRLYYMAIPELPDDIVSSSDDSFSDYHHKYTMISSTISTKFTRAEIEFIGDGVVLSAGTFTFGGAYISYNNDKFEEPLEDKSQAERQWQSMEVDESYRSLESRSISMTNSSDSSIIVTYSIYSVFDQAESRFTHNVLTKSYDFVLDTGSLEDGDEGMIEGSIEKITDNTNIHHNYPNIVSYNDQGNLTFSISYLTDTIDNQTLTESRFTIILPPDDNSEYAFLVILALGTVILSGSYFAIQKLVHAPQKEKEILPHEINLKEAISED